MKYALLIYAAEKSQEEQGRVYAEYMNYTVELKKSSKMLSRESLDPTSTPTTIRVRDGKTISHPTASSRTRRSSLAASTSSMSKT